MEEKFYFFWSGFCSNWHPAKFKYKGHQFANSEQAYMWEKAIFFKDEECAEDILKATDPKMAKSLGRVVKGFIEYQWNKVSYDFMYDVCFEKFNQNPKLKKMLLDTEDKMIVEASPYDKIWGIGLRESDARNTPMEKWRGENRLGKVLMDVREELK